MGAPRRHPIAVIGAGSWGTALAVHLARQGNAAYLWGRDAGQLDAMRLGRCNARYLPGILFPDSLGVVAQLADAAAAARDVLVAVPSHAFRATLSSLAPHLQSGSRIAWATKGFEMGSGLLPHQVAHEVLGPRPVAVLSGPTFAAEVGRGVPTAMAVASTDASFGADLATCLSGPNFRAYLQTDITGVEVGGAVKNVIAIACGIADGMDFGANTRVALITRGLAEMMRLGVKLGAARDTFMGLAGLGDLVLTCTDEQSRNRRFGLSLARGASAAGAAALIGQVVEGAQAARAVREVAARRGVEMPICHEVFRIMHEGRDIREAALALMGREMRAEQD